MSKLGARVLTFCGIVSACVAVPVEGACPDGSFWAPEGCYQCPAGYVREWIYPVDDARSCQESGGVTAAVRVGATSSIFYSCTEDFADSFPEFPGSTECYKCPSGFAHDWTKFATMQGVCYKPARLAKPTRVDGGLSITDLEKKLSCDYLLPADKVKEILPYYAFMGPKFSAEPLCELHILHGAACALVDVPSDAALLTTTTLEHMMSPPCVYAAPLSVTDPWVWPTCGLVYPMYEQIEVVWTCVDAAVGKDGWLPLLTQVYGSVVTPDNVCEFAGELVEMVIVAVATEGAGTVIDAIELADRGLFTTEKFESFLAAVESTPQCKAALEKT